MPLNNVETASLLETCAIVKRRTADKRRIFVGQLPGNLCLRPTFSLRDNVGPYGTAALGDGFRSTEADGQHSSCGRQHVMSKRACPGVMMVESNDTVALSNGKLTSVLVTPCTLEAKLRVGRGCACV